MTASAYRTEIDGLRAIAVLAVLVYHLSPALLPGGFVGVDVFFVISGYVVSRSLLQRRDASIGSALLGFYQRRVQRLLPALLVMLLVVAIVFALLVPAFPREGQQFIYRFGALSALGLSNLYAIRARDSYFDGDGVDNPFLHTWSLGVEEQFYLLYPLLLLACIYRLRARSQIALWMVLAVAGIGSMALCAALTVKDSVLAHYLMPARFWELAVGCALALNEHSGRTMVAARLASAVHWLALTALLAALYFTKAAGFPFPAALPAVLATAVLIAAPANSTLVYRLLQTRPLQYLGQISYSVYLWHWPVIVLVDALLGPSVGAKVLAVVLSIAFGMGSFHSIEQLFRRRAATALWVLIAGTLAALATSAAMWLIAANADRLYLGQDQAWDSVWSAPADAKIFAGDISVRACHVNGEIEAELKLEPPCYALANTTQPAAMPTLFVVGDSHALSSWKMTTSGANQGRYNVYVKSHNGCAVSFPGDGAGSSCQHYWQKIERLIERAARPGDFVYLALYFRSYGYSARENAALERLVAAIERSGARLIVEAPLPVFPEMAVDCIPEWFRLRQRQCEIPRASAEAANARALGLLLALTQRHKNVRLWDANALLCPDAVCHPLRDGLPLYRDDDHLSLHGSALLAPHFLAFLAALEGKSK